MVPGRDDPALLQVLIAMMKMTTTMRMLKFWRKMTIMMYGVCCVPLSDEVC